MRFLILTIIFLFNAIPVDSHALKIEKSEAQISELPHVASTSNGQFQTKAEYACLLDYETDTVLLDKRANEKMFPSSMSKLMTIYIAFHQLKNGELKLDDEFTISERAWRMGGSRMFLDLGSRVRVEDLVKGVIIQSGNDASVALAEGIAGSEETFVRYMNEAAKELKLDNSKFENATGWPHDDHQMSSQDLAYLASAIIRDYPEYYHYFAEKDMTYNKITQGNRNTLLGNGGVDGLKTGHTDGGGYGVVVSALKNGNRLIAVVNGLKNDKERAVEAERLLVYGFNNFQHHELAKTGEILKHIPLHNGKEIFVEAKAEKAIMVMLPKKIVKEDIVVVIDYDQELKAPIALGQQIAVMSVTKKGQLLKVVPLYAEREIQEASFMVKAWRNIQKMFGVNIYRK